jgi:hypothetical protein
MLSAILNWLSGGILGQITGPLLEAYKVKVNSTDEAAKLAAQDTIDARKAAVQVRMATAGYWEMRLLTVIIAAPFALHVWLVGLDTCFGFHWRIAAFPAPFDQWEGAILLSFFGVSVIGSGIKAIAGAIALGRTK